MFSTIVTDGTSPIQYLLPYTGVVGYPIGLTPVWGLRVHEDDSPRPGMEGEHAMRARSLVDLTSAPGASRFHRWAGGVIGLLLLMTLWNAWVWTIGFRPCALSYLLWR